MRENHRRHPSESPENRFAHARRRPGVGGVRQAALAARAGRRLRGGRAQRQTAAGQRRRSIAARADQLRAAYGTRAVRPDVQLER